MGTTPFHCEQRHSLFECLPSSNGLRELNAIGGERKTARQVPRRLVCRFQSANRTEVQTLFSVLLYSVIVGVVVVPIL